MSIVYVVCAAYLFALIAGGAWLAAAALGRRDDRAAEREWLEDVVRDLRARGEQEAQRPEASEAREVATASA